MGCSAGMIAVGLAQRLLKAEPGKYALVVSTENITQNWCAHRASCQTPVVHRAPACLCAALAATLGGCPRCERCAAMHPLAALPGLCALLVQARAADAPHVPARYHGNDRSMLIPNTLFRVGAAAMILTNKLNERRRAKYQLEHTVRVHLGSDTMAYECALLRAALAGLPAARHCVHAAVHAAVTGQVCLLCCRWQPPPPFFPWSCITASLLSAQVRVPERGRGQRGGRGLEPRPRQGQLPRRLVVAPPFLLPR